MGLQTAVESLHDDWSRRGNVEVDFECRNWSKGRISSEASLVLYRVLQESLNNVAKYSGARQISVILEMQKDQIIEIIEAQPDMSVIGEASHGREALAYLNELLRIGVKGYLLKRSASSNLIEAIRALPLRP
jgi:signal transduction histidine kinase